MTAVHEGLALTSFKLPQGLGSLLHWQTEKQLNVLASVDGSAVAMAVLLERLEMKTSSNAMRTPMTRRLKAILFIR